MHRRPDPRAILLGFAAVYTIWGTTFLGIALTIRSIPPFLAGGIRFLAAGAILYAYLRTRERRPFSGLNIGGTILCGVLLSGAGNGFIIWAQQGVPSGIAALFVGSIPVIVLLLDWMFFSHRAPTPVAAFGLALGLGGLAVLALHTQELPGHVRPIQICAVLIAAFAWSLGTLLQRRFTGTDRIMNFTCLQMIVGGAFQLLMGFVDHEGPEFSLSHITLQSGLALLYLIVFGSLIAANCYTFIVAHVGAARVSTYALVNPLIALTLGALVLGEKITPATMLAAGLVLIGVALVLWQGRPRGPNKPAKGVAQMTETAASGAAAPSGAAPPLAVSPRRLV
jgi:drug/metabolite transporter (DMT)-like permease